jgi:glycosyltransferase involved in cell wall biosynthesis
MSKIRILAIPSDQYGVGKFRIMGPYTHLQENYGDDFHIDIKYNVEDNDSEFDNYDVVVLHSFIHNKVPFEKNIERIDWLKKKGVIVVCDIDDYWEPDHRHPMHRQIIKSETHKKKVQLLRASDYVTTTTPIFRDTIIKRLGVKNVLVFPNAIDENESQFKSNPEKSDKIRFGWLGGSSHLYDLELIKSGISSTLSSYKDKTQFVLCGFDLRGNVNEVNQQTGEVKQRPIKPMETVWYQYEKMFTDDYKILSEEYKNYLLSFKEDDYNDVNEPYRRRWTKEISKYATNYNLFDVSLAPVVESLFNGNKSQLKVIEAGFHKKAIIASECDPYTIDLISAVDQGTFNNKGNALLVSPRKNHKQWAQHMKKLVENPNMVEDLGNRLYETVKDKYSLNTVNKNRAEFFKSIIKK